MVAVHMDPVDPMGCARVRSRSAAVACVVEVRVSSGLSLGLRVAYSFLGPPSLEPSRRPLPGFLFFLSAEPLGRPLHQKSQNENTALEHGERASAVFGRKKKKNLPLFRSLCGPSKPRPSGCPRSVSLTLDTSHLSRGWLKHAAAHSVSLVNLVVGATTGAAAALPHKDKSHA